MRATTRGREEEVEVRSRNLKRIVVQQEGVWSKPVAQGLIPHGQPSSVTTYIIPATNMIQAHSPDYLHDPSLLPLSH